MSTFGISQNFRATSIIGRLSRTVVPEPEKAVEVVEDDDHDDDDDDDDEEDEDDDVSKKVKALKVSKAKVEKAVALKAEAKKYEERVSCNKQFASFMNRYSEKTADHH